MHFSLLCGQTFSKLYVLFPPKTIQKYSCTLSCLPAYLKNTNLLIIIQAWSVENKDRKNTRGKTVFGTYQLRSERDQQRNNCGKILKEQCRLVWIRRFLRKCVIFIWLYSRKFGLLSADAGYALFLYSYSLMEIFSDYFKVLYVLCKHYCLCNSCRSLKFFFCNKVKFTRYSCLNVTKLID